MDMSRLPKRRCFATGKVIFVTRHAARSAMFKMKWEARVQRVSRKKRPKQRREYYCEHCGGFHLTKMEFPRPENRDEPKEPRLEPFIGAVRWFDPHKGRGVVVLPDNKPLHINKGIFPDPYSPPLTGDILVGQYRDDAARGRDVAVYCRPASTYEDWRLLFGLLGRENLISLVDTDNRFASVRVSGHGANMFKFLELGTLQLCRQHADSMLLRVFFTYYKQELDPEHFIPYVAVIDKAVALTRDPEDAAHFLDKLYGLFARKMDSYLKLAWWQQQPLSVEVHRPTGAAPTFWFGDYEGILLREDTHFADAMPYIDYALARLQSGVNLEVSIEMYNPESQCLFIQLTEHQVSTLIENDLSEHPILKRRYEPAPEVPEFMNTYTVIETARSIAIVELNKSCKKNSPHIFYEGIDAWMGSYAPAYRLWTHHTEPKTIIEVFMSERSKTHELCHQVGDMERLIKENVALQYQLIQGRDFAGRLAEMIVGAYPDMEVIKDDKTTVFRNQHYNILIGHADSIDFRRVDWPNYSAYATQRFIFIQLPSGNRMGRRPRIDIDHRTLYIGSDVVTIEPILAASFATLCEVMDENAVTN